MAPGKTQWTTQHRCALDPGLPITQCQSSALGWSRRSRYEAETQHSPPSCSPHQQNACGMSFLRHPCPSSLATPGHQAASGEVPGHLNSTRLSAGGWGGDVTGWEDDQWLRLPVEPGEPHPTSSGSLEDDPAGHEDTPISPIPGSSHSWSKETTEMGKRGPVSAPAVTYFDLQRNPPPLQSLCPSQ